MTTKVHISNEGPELVKVEVQGRSVSGQFIQAWEEFVEPHKFRTFYVHSGQSLQVIEVLQPNTAPTPAPDTAGNSEGLLS